METSKIIKKLIEYDFRNMNERQFEAVTTVNGPLLVLAGAGSGKTTVLVNRIAYLLKYGNAYNSEQLPALTQAEIEAAEDYIAGKTDYLPEGAYSVQAPHDYQILAITFTNKAADELKTRISKKLGSLSDNIWAGTFHSICGKILRFHADKIGYSSSFTIYDADDQQRVMKTIVKDAGVDEKMFTPKSVLNAISHAKDSLISPEEFEQSAGNDYRGKILAALYREYQKRLISSNAMDFDDMIANTVLLFGTAPEVLRYYSDKFKYIMVDEYQDTNHAQYELIRLLSGVHNNLCVVGDDDQSIYRFRGATIENILNFEDNFKNAKIIRLEQNYRSTENILSAANSVISNNRGRKGKTLWTDFGEGNLLSVYAARDERDEAKYVADKIFENVDGGDKFSDNAVLYRMNAQSANFENVFARSGIPYRVIGGMRFYERKEIKDILSYLCLINNPADNLRLTRIINEPARGIGTATVNKIRDIAAANNTSMLFVISRADEYEALSRVSGRLKEFYDIIDGLISQKEYLSLSELTENLLEKSGYRNALILENTEEAKDRLENIKEFYNTICLYEQENEEPSLASFLEEIALVSDIDSFDSSEDRVTLMTVHSAKGLEFKNVFLVGLEEGIFPGMQSLYGGPQEIEEERRLAYVAITRAKRNLTITRATTRMLYGSTGRNLPSRFLREIPEECCSFSEAEPLYSSFVGYNGGYSGGRDYSPYSARERTSFTGGFSAKTEKTEYIDNYSKNAIARESTKYSIGQTVEHKTFGKGLIISAKPMGNDTLLEIAFDSAGTKKLMANFAKLKPIE
ncbi:MAG: UvrD-helicase domain-containing protein [Clostridia bacterium]|nr:UvrD-helicase domain-containing protein [Clostridia bacterium]